MSRAMRRCVMVLALLTLCLAVSSSAVAAVGARSSTRAVAAESSIDRLAQQGQDDEEGARVGKGRRVRAGRLPFTGRVTAQWIALAVASVLVGAGFVTAATPARAVRSVLAPLGARLVRAASCGFELEVRIFDVERARARSD